MVQDDVFFLHEYEVIDSLSFSAKIPCRWPEVAKDSRGM